MRDYAALVKALRTCKMSIPCTECPFYSNGDEPSKECATMNVAAADAIEELLAAVPKWISVEERLPEESGTVLVYRDGCCGVARLLDVEPEIMWTYTGFGGDPTHWMPLPQPPIRYFSRHSAICLSSAERRSSSAIAPADSITRHSSAEFIRSRVCTKRKNTEQS